MGCMTAPHFRQVRESISHKCEPWWFRAMSNPLWGLQSSEQPWRFDEGTFHPAPELLRALLDFWLWSSTDLSDTASFRLQEPKRGHDDGNARHGQERIAHWIRIIVPGMPPGSAVGAGRKRSLVVRHVPPSKLASGEVFQAAGTRTSAWLLDGEKFLQGEACRHLSLRSWAKHAAKQVLGCYAWQNSAQATTKFAGGIKVPGGTRNAEL